MSWEDINKNLSTRKKDSLHSAILPSHQSAQCQIILSSDDQGVIRNGGRNGSKYGPMAIIGSLKKMSAHKISKSLNIFESVNDLEKENDFDSFQKQQIKTIEKLLSSASQSNIHIGSGHDFIYPFAKAIYNTSKQSAKKIAIINFDAHLDTRNDKIHHSGTPFRQLSEEIGQELKIYQIGIHNYANATSNFDGVEMKIFTLEEICDQTDNMKNNDEFISNIFEEIKDFETIILSIDLDAIKSEQMFAVSAPNHNGLSFEFLHKFTLMYKELNLQKEYIGIYEYNPLFDDLAVSNARRVNSLIIEFLK